MSVFGIHTGRGARERGTTNGSGSAAVPQRSYRRPLQMLLAAMVLVVGAIPFLPEQASADPLPAGVSNPPVTGSIISFPQRDFVSSEGWDETVFPAVDVQVLRQNPNNAADYIQIGVAHDVVPANGFVEVNHPGGACWEGVTPNITAGDIVMLSGKDAPGGTIIARDATTTANVTITQTVTEIAPGSVEVRGRALRADGSAIDAGELEMRLISGAADRFDVNNKRDLRAPRDGTFTIDANGDWVAIINGLGQADVDRAVAAENRVVWLGSNPAAGTEATIFEVGDAVVPGPTAECPNAPLQGAVVTASRTQIDFPATEITLASAPETVTILNAGAGALADLQVSEIKVTGIDALDFHVTDTCVGTPVPVGGTCQLDIIFNPSTAGPKQATLQVLSNAGNSVVPLDVAGLATGVAEQIALGVARPAFVGFATRSVDNTSPVQSLAIKNIGNADLHIATIGFSGDFPGDYTITATTCAGATVAPNTTCSISLTFTPHGEGNRDAALDVASDGAPVNVALQGGGLVTTGIIPNELFNGVQLGVFTARDFVSNGGFKEDEVITAQIIRSGVVIGQGTAVAGADGVAEVNHPGGGCWENSTPNIRAGDVLRVTRPDGRMYEMVTADVKVTTRTTEVATGIVEMKGYARDLTTGGPLPLAQIEARVIGASRDPFTINGKRSIRTGDLGTLTYDPISASNPDGVNWTATWDLSQQAPTDVAHDVQLALTEENRILWLGRDPLALSEMTFWEDGDAVADGPGGSCTAPGQPVSPGIAILPSTRTFPALAIERLPLAAESATRDFTVRNIGTAPLTISSVTFAGIASGDFSVTSVPSGPIAPDGVGTITVRFTPRALGTRTATMRVNDNSIGSPHTATVTGIGVATSQPAALVTPTALAFPDTQVSVNSTPLTVTVTNEGGLPLAFDTAPAVSGPNAADFAVANSSTCSVSSTVASLQSCTIDVVFTPSDVNGRSATLTIDTNDPTGNVTVALSGISTTTADGTFDPPRAPHDVQAFPVRDYVSAGGYAANEKVRIEVYRGGNLIAETADLEPKDQDPSDLVFNGLVEVNHAGGFGWLGETPDILPGDVVRAVRLDGAGVRLSADQTHVGDLTVTMPATEVAPGVVVVTGTAADADTGAPLAPGSVEPRITSTTGLFDINGRRDMRSGDMTWDGIEWTATFSGLSAADVQRAVTGDSKVVWLGRVPLNLSELTHWEWAEIPGPDPAFALSAPFHEQEPTVNPAVADIGFSGVSVSSSPVTITFQNSANADAENALYDPTLTPDVVGIVGLHAGDFHISSTTCGAPMAPSDTCTVSVYLNATALGTRVASLWIDHDGANGVTLVPLTGIGVAVPTLTSATSPVGHGSVVHLVGTNLASTTEVTIAGIPVAFTVVSDTAVDFIVPAGVPTVPGAPSTAGIVLTSAAGSASINTSVLPDVPIISSVGPNTGKAGDTVTITGLHLLGASVTFNGVAANVSANTDGSITTAVPTGATTGLLRVSTIGGAATSPFTVIPAPTITGFAPATARRLATITVNGTNFQPGTLTVAFTNATGGDAVATPTNITATSFRVVVPNGAVQGPVKVTVTRGAPIGAQTTSAVFTVELAPANITVAPTSGAVGQSVTLTGNNFLTTTKVSFNGRSAAFTIVNSRTITATVPGGATTGTIQVGNKWGSANSPTFTVIQPPTITGFTPVSVSASAVADSARRVTVNGANLGFATSVVLVRGTTTVVGTAVTRVSATQITFVVPAGSPTGPYTIRATSPAGAASSISTFTINP